MMKQAVNTARSAATTVGPMAVAKMMDSTVPERAEIAAMTTAETVTLLKLLKSLIADRAGKMISADARSAPKRFIARTTVTAVMTAMRVLYAATLMPAEAANDSSKVTANILL